jgi:1-acyl-sn-glycerol-3-phosphate acyltransferase
MRAARGGRTSARRTFARRTGQALLPAGQGLRHAFGPARTVAGALAVTGALVPAYLALRLVHRPTSERVPRLYLRGLARTLGIASKVHGQPVSGRVLYVANHLSWIDIPVLGGHLNASFVAKREVSDMGYIGRLADMGQTLYVDRSRRRDSAAQADEIAARLAAGGNVILFPEGTSNDGIRVLPFKSALFSVVDRVQGLRVQPVTLAYTEVNGLPITRHRVLDIAWIGDMELAPHVVEVARLGRIRAEILFHEPVEAGAFPSRKALASHCHQVISRGYGALMRGSS